MHLTRARPTHLSRRALIVLLAGLLSFLLSAALVRAQPPTKQPAQAESQVYLPIVAQQRAQAPAGAPVIEAFQLSAAAGPMAAEVELRWRVRGATQLGIEPGVGDVLGGASAFIYPIATTTYTLTASNERGSTTATATYTVNALPIPNPLTVSARPDTERAASMRIGASGGTVEASDTDGTRYTLVVPPEALLYSEVITLTPVAAIEGMPFAATGVRAVSIAPEGLLFIEPATLTITPPAEPTASRTIGLAFQGAGSEFHLRTLQSAGAKLAPAAASNSLSVVTSRSYGTADVADDDLLAPTARRAPSDPLDAVEHVTVTQDADPKPGPFSIYYGWVQPLLEIAVNDPNQVDAAAQQYIRWRAMVKGWEDELREEISQANLLLGEALRKAGELTGERCNENRPAQGFALQRYMAYAKRFGLVNTRAALEERLAKCWVFELTFHSRMDQRSEGVSSLYELKASLLLNYQPGGRMIGSAPLNWERFDITAQDGCPITATSHQGSTFKADGDALGLWIEPVSRSSPDVSFRLSYEVGQPTAHWTVTCPDEPPVSFSFSSPFWWVAYGEMHSDERQGDGFTAQAPTVNPNAFLGWIYDNTFAEGETTEHTEIRLEHTPAR